MWVCATENHLTGRLCFFQMKFETGQQVVAPPCKVGGHFPHFLCHEEYLFDFWRKKERFSLRVPPTWNCNQRRLLGVSSFKTDAHPFFFQNQVNSALHVLPPNISSFRLQFHSCQRRPFKIMLIFSPDGDAGKWKGVVDWIVQTLTSVFCKARCRPVE